MVREIYKGGGMTKRIRLKLPFIKFTTPTFLFRCELRMRGLIASGARALRFGYPVTPGEWRMFVLYLVLSMSVFMTVSDFMIFKVQEAGSNQSTVMLSKAIGNIATIFFGLLNATSGVIDYRRGEPR